MTRWQLCVPEGPNDPCQNQKHIYHEPASFGKNGGEGPVETTRCGRGPLGGLCSTSAVIYDITHISWNAASRGGSWTAGSSSPVLCDPLPSPGLKRALSPSSKRPVQLGSAAQDTWLAADLPQRPGTLRDLPAVQSGPVWAQVACRHPVGW